MEYNELSKLNKKEIVEVNGIQLGFMVSMISTERYEKEHENILLKYYYKFLKQSKQNGFSTQYIKMPVADAVYIFKNMDELDIKSIR